MNAGCPLTLGIEFAKLLSLNIAEFRARRDNCFSELEAEIERRRKAQRNADRSTVWSDKRHNYIHLIEN